MPQQDREFKAFENLERLRQLFPSLTTWLTTSLTYLRGLRTTAFKLRFPTLTHLLERLGLYDVWCKVHLPLELSTSLGYVTDEYEVWRKKIAEDLNNIHEELRVFLEENAVREEEARVRRKELAKQRFDELSSGGSLASQVSDDDEEEGDGAGKGGKGKKGNVGNDEASRASGATKLSLIEKLRRLGVTEDSLDMLVDDEPKDPAEYAMFIAENTSKSDVQTHIVWEKVSKVCNGLNSLDVFSGKAMFNMGFSGWDLFSLVPATQSIQVVKDDIAERKLWRVKLQRQLQMVGVNADQVQAQQGEAQQGQMGAAGGAGGATGSMIKTAAK